MNTRQDHLDWCKQRAIQVLDSVHDAPYAYDSFVSDLNKDDSTRNHQAIQLGYTMLFSKLIETENQMRTFINGFN